MKRRLSGETARGFEAGDGTELHAVVKQLAAGVGSPQQISHRLVLDFPDGRSVRVSHETIYLELFTPTRAALRGGHGPAARWTLLLASAAGGECLADQRGPEWCRSGRVGGGLFYEQIALIEQGRWGATRQS